MLCTLHIGMHKTGSSAIQFSLDGYDDGENFYADIGEPNHSVPIYTAFSNRTEKYEHLLRRGLSPADIAALGAQAKTAIASAISRTDRHQVIFSGEDINRLGYAGVKQLVEFLSCHCSEIVSVIYVREPLDYAVSTFQQSVKAGLDSVPDSCPPSYRSRIQPFVEQLGMQNVRVRNYSTISKSSGGVVADFAQLCGLKLLPSSSTHTNKSISSTALKLLFLFNRTNPVSTGDATLMQARELLIQALAYLTSEAPPIPKRIFASLADYSDVDWLERECGVKFERADMPISDEASWLDAVPESTCSSLRALLLRNGVQGNYKGGVEALVNRLFYLCLGAGRFDARSGMFEK